MTKKTKQTTWDGHGMVDDQEGIDLGLELLGLLPNEATALVKYSLTESVIWDELSKVAENTDKRDRYKIIADWWGRRSTKWEELAKRLETQYDEITQTLK